MLYLAQRDIVSNKREGKSMWLENLKIMKERNGMTTKEISEKSGIPEPTLEKLFAGATKDPKLTTMQQLVHFLGYTLDDLDGDIASAKRTPDTVEAAPGESVSQIFDYLNDGLVSLGLIRDGEDITDQQAEVLLSICRIIRATFEDKQ